MRFAALVMVLVACGKAEEKPAPPPVKLATPDAAVVDAATPDAAMPAPAAPMRGSVALGMGWGCARTADAHAACWGRGFGDKAAVVKGLEHVAGVATGQAALCAWTTDGKVFCGEGEAPARVAGVDDAVEVAVDPDAFEFCARRRTGAIACWRDLGAVDPIVAVPGIEGAEEIAVAGTTVCARHGGDVLCWNGNDAKPRRIDAATGATRIAGGYFKFVALRSGKGAVGWDEEGKAAKLPAFDADTQQVSIDSDGICARGARTVCWYGEAPPVVITGAAGARDLAIGWSVACAAVGSELRCWGQIGSLGDGNSYVTDTPVPVADLSDAVQIDVAEGAERTCARRATGATVCWGATKSALHDAAPVADGTKLVAHKVTAWSGGNGRGQWTCKRAKGHVACTQSFFGRHGETDLDVPDDSWGNLDDIRDMRMPNNDSDIACIADATGSVTCFSAWEQPDRGAVIADVTDAIRLVPYGESTCALERSGTVKCWNERERQYNGGTVKTVAGITDAVELASSDLHVCARHKTGAVSCWGVRPLLGDGANSHQREPLVVPGVSL
ncbi:MAG TPA: hypothetical protein VGM88_17870 [Kofleriaceae bacterium]